jgi:long-chain fatty acid transport protein
MRKTPFFTFSLALASAITCLQAQAGGLWITEYGQPTQGRAGAGEEAGNGDATDAFFNPAAMTRLEKSEILISAGVIAASIEFDVEESGIVNGDGNGGEAAGPVPGGSVFYAHPLNDKWSVGLSIVALTGSVLDYDDDWAGRFQVQDVSLVVIGLVPSVAYKVTDKFSVGVSVPVMYSKLDMDVGVPNPMSPIEGPGGSVNVEGDDTQVAGTLSFLYQFSDRTRLGGRVTSKFDFEYGGDISADLLGSVGVTTEITMADILRVGLSHDFNEKWSGYATWGWENWSAMKDVIISNNNNGVALSRNWDDTYHYAVGTDYRLGEHWTLRAGVGYDTNPVDAKDRTADMPLDEQFRYAIGADYIRDSGMRISGSLIYADYGDAEIDSDKALPVFGLQGKYKNNDLLFANISFNWPIGGGSR